MNLFNAAKLADLLTRLDSLQREAADLQYFFGAKSSDDVFPDLNTQVYELATEIRELSEAVVFSRTNTVANQVLAYLNKANSIHIFGVESELRHLGACLLEEASVRRFLYICSDRTNLVDSECLFGHMAYDAFPTARSEIAEAGNCMVAECNTAAVFHLMRVAEIGLRALAWGRRITIPKNKPVELANWEEILRELESAEYAIQGFKKTLAREAQLSFYHGAMMEFRAFKNVWRNQVMHTRSKYDRDQADSVFVHVRGFLNILATKISEGNRTPLVWKKP